MGLAAFEWASVVLFGDAVEHCLTHLPPSITPLGVPKDVVHSTGGCTGKLVARIGGRYGNRLHGTGGKPAGYTGSLREGADVGAPRSAPRAQQGRFFYVCGGAVIACRSQPEA